jgi:hypothetical protein
LKSERHKLLLTFIASDLRRYITELYASGHAMDAATAARFADMLAVNTTLTALCIGDPEFGDAGLLALTPGLAASASLASIDLENKGVGDVGAAALGKVWRCRL